MATAFSSLLDAGAAEEERVEEEERAAQMPKDSHSISPKQLYTHFVLEYYNYCLQIARKNRERIKIIKVLNPVSVHISAISLSLFAADSFALNTV